MRWLVLACVASAACGGHARRAVTGAELYREVGAIRAAGQATIRDVVVRRDQVLATASQQFLVAQLVENCKGGDPAEDGECALALLLAETFEVRDQLRAARAKREEDEDRSRSMVSAVAIVGVAVGVTAGLVYGVATCEFEGCKAVFGVPLVLVGGGIGFALLGP